MRRVATLIFILTIVSGCGRKGPLIYPEMTAPAAPTAVSARQTGQAIQLSIDLPQKDQAGRKLANLAGVSILRRAAPMGQSPDCSACMEGFSLFRKLYLDLPLSESGVQRFGSQLVLRDEKVRESEEYSYTVTPFTKDSQDGLPSRPITTGMVVPPSAPMVRAEPHPTEIRLVFSSTPQINGVFVGYNLYRTQKGDVLPFLPLTNEPIAGNSFVDVGLVRSQMYVYAARTVIRLPTGKLVESELSGEVEARLTNE